MYGVGRGCRLTVEEQRNREEDTYAAHGEGFSTALLLKTDAIWRDSMTRNEKSQRHIEYGSEDLGTMTRYKGRCTRKVRYST